MEQNHAWLSKYTIAMQIYASGFSGSLALVAFHSYARLAEPDVVHMWLILSSVCMVCLHRTLPVHVGCITSGGSCSSSWQVWSSHGSFISAGASALR